MKFNFQDHISKQFGNKNSNNHGFGNHSNNHGGNNSNNHGGNNYGGNNSNNHGGNNSNSQGNKVNLLWNRKRKLEFPATTNGVAQPKQAKSDFVGEPRMRLPIYPLKSSLIQAVKDNANLVLLGETGSGKTTQLPRFLYESGLFQGGVIACTQPRRVAAITVAQRVAVEMGVECGSKVGYTVRFDDHTTPGQTAIKYMTDGMLLREAILDPLLKKYSVVILDEAHERTVQTDVLFGIVKAAQKTRKERVPPAKPLHIVVMSATMNVDHFSEYFDKAPVIYVEGRQHKVDVMYSAESQSDYVYASLVTLFQLHREKPLDEAILLFLTGQEEIESVVGSAKALVTDPTNGVPRMDVVPLYASLPQHAQLRAFNKSGPNCRKVVVATNIAETSVTIQGIRHVIDCGKVKAKSFNATSGLDLLKVQNVSKAQAWQRTGRAGRESSGCCYRLYSEEEYCRMSESTVPEILRCNLAAVLLQIMAMGIKDVHKFDFMNKPGPDSVSKALETLRLLGAVEKSGESFSLTSLGQSMSAFPLDPKLAKVLLASKTYKCSEEVLSIVSLLSTDSVFLTPSLKREEAQASRVKFESSEGDHLSLLNVWRAYKSSNQSKDWCFNNFINGRNMKNAVEIRAQLKSLMEQAGIPLMAAGRENTAAIRKAFAAGFFLNAAELNPRNPKEFLTLAPPKQTAFIHPSSSLFRSNPSCVIYNELVKTNKCYMRDVCVVDPDWMAEFASNSSKSNASTSKLSTPVLSEEERRI